MKKEKKYGKTKRFGVTQYQITEKLDGSNVCFAKSHNKLKIYSRTFSFDLDELDDVKEIIDEDFYDFLVKYGSDLQESLIDEMEIYCEFLGTGMIDYEYSLGNAICDRLYIFGKKSPKDKCIRYDVDALWYAFINQNLPMLYLSIVPYITQICEEDLSIHDLDLIYDGYKASSCNSAVEGFIITNDKLGYCRKYVRHKNGKETEHIFKKEYL